MDELNVIFAPNTDSPRRTKSKEKRCWREIEAIKEQQRLRQELSDFCPVLGGDLDIDFD